MKLILSLAFLVLMITEIGFAQNPPPAIEPGVSQTLAKWRAAHYSDVRYRLNITLEKGAPLMRGEIEIGVKLTEDGAKNDLILDWRTTQFASDKDKPFADVVKVNDSVIKELPDSGNFAYAIDKEHIIVAKRLLKAGENTIKISFASPIKTSGAAVTRYTDKEDGAEYLYSLFVPSDASMAFPVFDQPDLKARFSLTLKRPENWKVVSNTLPRQIQNLPLSHSEDAKKKVFETAFDETQPISTYVFAFAAGEFAEFEDKTISTASRERGSKTIAGHETSGKRDQDLRVEDASEKESARISDARFDADLPGRFTSGYSLDASSTQKAENLSSKIYVRKSQAEKFKPHAAEVFRLNREGVKYLESYFDYKYPFPKYDLVLIPEFPFGGMEHAGATFLREASIIFPSEPTKNDFISRANLIFHEAAHQWFGDTVTMRWFDDLWLKEGFAEFMAYKTLAQVMPEYNAWKAFYERNKPLAYLTDATRGTTPIYQEIPNLSSAKSAYGNIVYRKAPSFLRQAEFYLGEKEFQTAVRAFLKKHEYANAEWTDLVSEFQNASFAEKKKEGFYARLSIDEKQGYEDYERNKLNSWAETWVKGRGMPIVRISPELLDSRFTPQWSINVFNETANGFVPVNFEQAGSVGENLDWQQDINVLKVFINGEREIVRANLGARKYYTKMQSSTDWDSPLQGKYPTQEEEDKKLEKRKALYIFPNYQDYGYGTFLLDAKSRNYVLKNIGAEKDDFLRSMMWGTLWDSVREAELNPKDYVELAIKNIAVESDESTINAILGRVSTALSYYLPDAQRDTLAARLETVLTDRIANAETPGQRITFYRAYLNLASSAAARQNLKDILAGKSKLAVFQLRTKDKFDLVTRLLVLGDADAPNLLANLEKAETSDDAKRYAYAARAAAATRDSKAKYFKDFMTNKEISESWIEAALPTFNSSRHSELTLPYLETALAELPNLKRTRKIFFVNGWLGAFLGGQKSREALNTVSKFLAANQNLDKDLRLKILENVDGLERAVKIREKYGK